MSFFSRASVCVSDQTGLRSAARLEPDDMKILDALAVIVRDTVQEAADAFVSGAVPP